MTPLMNTVSYSKARAITYIVTKQCGFHAAAEYIIDIQITKI